MKKLKYITTSASIIALSAMGMNAQAQDGDQLVPVSAANYQTNGHTTHVPSRAIDGNSNTRWVGRQTNASIVLDLGSVKRLDDVAIEWGGDGNRTHDFEIFGRIGTSGNWNSVFEGESDGTDELEVYNVDDIDARFVRVHVYRNSLNRGWQNIREIEVYGNNNGSSSPPPPPPPPPPSGGNGVDVPARIEAESFVDYSDTTSNNIGGAFRNTPVDLQSCNDSGCGFNVGWTAAGEWLEYDIEVDDSSNYEIGLRYATPNNGRVMSVDVDGQNTTGNISLNNTGNWQNYSTRTVSLGNLSSGSHTVRVNFENGAVNLNWIDLDETGGSSSPPPPSPPPPPPPPTSSNTNIVVSNSSNRSNTSNLNGQTVDGNIYVLVTDNNVDRVDFFIDNSFVKTENFGPFDLQGGPNSGANPYDTDDLSNGNHTLRAEVLFNNGSTDTLTANFTVDNGGSSSPPPPPPPPSGGGNFGLNPNDHPWENFDLRFWKIDTPAGESSSSDCDAQDFEPYQWNSVPGSRSDEFFFTHSDGGMRFVSEIGGGTTGGSCNSRPRSELREMLRGSNSSIDTTGKNGDYRNNWALGYQPNNHAGNSGESWGAREGTMRATLRVNKVTTSGKSSSRGRTVIGQIHAKDDEPLRLNYKHVQGHQGGCIYAASEQNGGSDTNFILAGNNTSCSQDPGNNGLGLGELFSYEIENDDEDIIVTIYEGDFGNMINRITIDLDQINGNYDVNDDWMYFKAGAYTQNSINDDGNEGDTDIVTFYRLDVDH